MGIYAPDQNEMKGVEFWKKVKDYILTNKKAYEKVWHLISAMLIGQQYVESEDIFSIRSKAPSWRVRMVCNRILPIYTREISRLTTGPALMDVLPASDSPEDKNRASLSEKILAYLLQTGRLDLEGKHEEFCSWMLRSGTGIYKVEWSSDSGDLITEYETQPTFQKMPKLDNFGQPLFDPVTGTPLTEEIFSGKMEVVKDEEGNPVEKDKFRLGDITVRVISPFDFAIPDRYYEIQEAPWVCHYYTARIEDLQKKYDNAKFLSPNLDISTEKFYAEKNRSIASSFTMRSMDSSMVSDIARESKFAKGSKYEENREGLAVVYEIWMKGDDKTPEGKLLVVSQGTVLYDGKNPYQDGKYPFVVCRELPLYDRFWGPSILEQIIPLQKSYNRSRSQEIEDANLTANPILINYTAGGANKNSLINRPGAIIDVTMPTLEPKYLERNRVDAVIYGNVQQKSMADMQEIASQHEISRGQKPSGVRSGLALAYLSQMDEQSSTPKVKRLNKAREELARMILSRVHQFYLEERMIAIGGPGTDTEVLYFKGTDIVGTDTARDYFDVRIRPSSTAPVNKAAMKSEVLTYMQAGILNPMHPDDKRYIARMLDIGNSKEFMEEQRLDLIRAKKEIELLKNGEELEPRFYENHAIHMEEFIKFMKSQEFYELPQEIQNLFVNHLSKHQEFIDKSIRAMMPPPGAGNMMPQMDEGAAGENAEDIGRASDSGQAIISNMGGIKRGQRVSDLRGVYGGTGYE